MASFSVSGLVPISAAIAGSDVAITVESMFSMKRAVATMSGIRRCLFIEVYLGKAKKGRIGGKKWTVYLDPRSLLMSSQSTWKVLGQ